MRRASAALLAATALVLAVGPPAAAADEQLAEKVNKAISRGVDYLLAVQCSDGSWRTHDMNAFPTGQTALTLYTLVKSGVAPDHAAIQKGLAFIRSRPSTKTYEAGVLLMALEALGPGPHRELVPQTLDVLLLGQQTNGLWAYPHGVTDLSNTQYAVLGLRAAVRMGARVQEAAIRRTLDEILLIQLRDGGFGYTRNSAPTGSMTVAGLTVMLVCAELLDARGKLGDTTKRKVDNALAAGVTWLETHFSATDNPIPSDPNKAWDRWKHYYLYGLERFAAFAKKATIGEHDWYKEGAEYLVEAQGGGNGDWGNGYRDEHLASTCFSLLFLSRATASQTGVTSATLSRFDPVYGLKTAPVELYVTGRNPYQVWVASFSKVARSAYEWDDGELRVSEVRYLLDDEPLEAVRGDAPRGMGANRFPIEVTLDAPGTHELRAEVTLLVEGEAGETALLDSNLVTLAAENILTPADQDALRDLGANVLPAQRVRVAASSFWDDYWAPRNAADGYHATQWLTKEDDQERWIELTFDRPVRANAMKLAPTLKDGFDRNRYCRATRVTYFMNGRRRDSVDLPDDENAKHLIRFPTATFKVLKIQIDQVAPGHAHAGAVGFREVELFLDEAP